MNNTAATSLQQHFGLMIDPFSADALPEFFFVGAQRRFLAQRVVHALYFSGGIAMLSGARGSGKTKVLDQVMSELRELSDSCRIEANVLMDAAEIRRLIAASLGLPAAAAQSGAALVAAFAQWQPVGREPQPIVLVIDDAQLLSIPVLTECLLMTRSSGGRLRLLLVGEPELLGAWQQADGGTAEFIELPPLDRQECGDYVLTRLQAAGYRGAAPLTDAQLRDLHQQSRGNIGAIHSLLPALLEQRAALSHSRFSALADALKNPLQRNAAIAAAVLLVIVVPMLFHSEDKSSQPPATAPASVENKTSAADKSNANSSSEQRSIAITLPLAKDVQAAKATPTPPLTIAAPTPQENPAVAAAPAPSQSPPPNLQQHTLQTQNSHSQTPQPTSTREQQLPSPPGSAAKTIIAAPAATAKSAASADANSAAPVNAVGDEREQAAAPIAKPATAKESPNAVAARELTADESELLALPPEQYMLQLLGAESTATVAKFIAERGNGLRLYSYRTRHKNRPWNIVVVGPYPDRNAALAAVAKLPPALSAQKPWPRTLASVQAELRTH